MVVILDDIEYAGGKPKESQESNKQQNGTAPNTGAAAPAQPAAQSAGGQMPNGFTGYEPFGGGSFFDEN